jgi:hypothetical protein
MPQNALRRVAGLALLLACLPIASCAASPERDSDRPAAAAACLPAFPDRDGWYGGDGAYSVKLDERRVLWLFGDSFVSAQAGRRDRLGMDLVLGTTLAISTCSAEGQFQIRYYLKRKNGKFISSFGEGEWLWPQDPFIVERTLYVPLLSVKANPALAGPFKFEIAGHKFARIKDYAGGDPNRWPVEYLDLTPAIPAGIKAFATTSVLHRGHVYFYPLYGATKGGLSLLGNILARIPADRLGDPAGAIEYWTRDGQWERGLDHARVRIVLDAAVSELSVRYHPERRKWIAVYLSLENNGDRMLYRTADSPEGPWTEAKVLIGSIPEVDRSSPRYDRNNFCYAGKEHLDVARGRDLVVTYVCNSHEDFEKETSFIRQNLFLYRPVVRTPGL